MELVKDIEVMAEKIGLKKFKVLGIHNEGKALHIVFAMGDKRIGWWPNSRRGAVHISYPNGRSVGLLNIRSPVDFLDGVKEYQNDNTF